MFCDFVSPRHRYLQSKQSGGNTTKSEHVARAQDNGSVSLRSSRASGRRSLSASGRGVYGLARNSGKGSLNRAGGGLRGAVGLGCLRGIALGSGAPVVVASLGGGRSALAASLGLGGRVIIIGALADGEVVRELPEGVILLANQLKTVDLVLAEGGFDMPLVGAVSVVEPA